MTPIYGITSDGAKRTGRDMRILPRTVLYDPGLTLDLQVTISVTSAINALAHAAEGLYARDANPIHSLMAEEGIAAIARGVSGLHAAPRDLQKRTQLLYGAWLCGTVLGHVGMSLHHKLCHTLGGSFNLPHAETHSVILPHVLAYNASAAPVAMQRIARAIGQVNAPLGVHKLARDNGAPTSLAELGFRLDDLDRATDLAVSNPYWIPRPIERDAIRLLLENAHSGALPQSYDEGSRQESDQNRGKP